ncbi:MAG: Transcription initiation factor IIB [Marteilia pararefringens]
MSLTRVAEGVFLPPPVEMFDVAKCRNHPNSHPIQDHHAGDLICSECGLVLSERYLLLLGRALIVD